jgi:hypothetical protein
MTNKTVTGELSNWFGKPLADIPDEQREIAEGYLPNWADLSEAERRKEAEEVDRKRSPAFRMEEGWKNDEQNQRQEAERAVGWWDASLDAWVWWGMCDLEPSKAAMLLCSFNPNNSACNPQTDSTDETEPKHFKLLLSYFEDVAKSKPRPRTLREWHAAAHTRNLKHHSWIDEYERAVDWVVPSDPATLEKCGPSASSSAPYKAGGTTTTTHRIKTRSNILDAVIKKASTQAADPNDLHSRWAALVAMADLPESHRPPPILGFVLEEGVKYQDADGVKFLTKKAFLARVKRSSAKSR